MAGKCHINLQHNITLSLHDIHPRYELWNEAHVRLCSVKATARVGGYIGAESDINENDARSGAVCGIIMRVATPALHSNPSRGALRSALLGVLNRIVKDNRDANSVRMFTIRNNQLRNTG